MALGEKKHFRCGNI